MNITVIKDWVQVIAILIAGAWAIYTFTDNVTRQDELYRGRSAAAVSSCTLEVVGLSREFYVLKATVKVTSASKIRLHIFDSPYTVRGMVMSPIASRIDLAGFLAAASEKLKKEERFFHAGQYGDPNGLPVEVGRLWSSSDTLEPGETIQDERIFLVSEKSSKLFDWINVSFGLILSEDIKRLGHEAKFNADGTLESNLIVYDRPKKNIYAYSDANNKATVIPNNETGAVSRKVLLRSNNVASTFGVCNTLLPNKRLAPAAGESGASKGGDR